MGKSVTRLLGITSFFITLSMPLFAYEKLPKIPGNDLIYGNDDRVEIDQYKDSDFIEKSKSVAMKVSKRRLTVDREDANRILFPNITLSTYSQQFCSKERFLDQVSLGTCSGFLVGPKTLVTAGHCMMNSTECTNNQWVFGFKENVTELTASQVYSCKKIISQKYLYSKSEVSDYAVIELDREVEGHTPLKLRKIGFPRYNTPLLIIGHPMGLPMKATDGGVVGRMNDIERKTKLRSWLLRGHYMTSNLDAYGGNSGSPVFNVETGKVEGILVRGAEDFIYNQEKECYQSRRLSDSHHETYEKVMRITVIPGI